MSLRPILAAIFALVLAGAVEASTRAPSYVPRDSHGRIERSQAAKSEFKRQHPCPSTGRASGPCPGFVIDHRIPLKRGGADDPSNMQWMDIPSAKQKDKIE